MKRKLSGRVMGFFGKKPVIVLLILPVLVGLIGWWIQYNRAPAEGVISSNAVTQPTTQQVSKKGHYTGSTAEFDYSAQYTDIHNNAANGLIVEQYSLKAPSKDMQGTKRISVTIYKIDNGILMKEDSGYKLRVGNPAQYSYETIQVDNQNVEKFTKTDNSEITYYVPGSHYYAVLAGTSSNVGNGLSDDITDVLGSFKWLK